MFRKPWQTEESLKAWKIEQAARCWKDPRTMDKSLIPDDSKFHPSVWLGYFILLWVPFLAIGAPAMIAYDLFVYHTSGPDWVNQQP